MDLEFECDEDNDVRNLQKHKISFEEAKTVFADPFSITIDDPKHSVEERRFIDIGMSATGNILVVSYTERRKIRLISSRKATKSERKMYEEKKDTKKAPQDDDEMLSEYDFRAGVRGKHYESYRNGHTVTVHKSDGTTQVQYFKLEEGAVMLEIDVRKYFPDSEAVNKALRGLITLLPTKSRTGTRRRS